MRRLARIYVGFDQPPQLSVRLPRGPTTVLRNHTVVFRDTGSSADSDSLGIGADRPEAGSQALILAKRQLLGLKLPFADGAGAMSAFRPNSRES